MLPDAPFWGACHQQPIVSNPALYRVIAEIPPGEGGHVREGVLLRHVGGLANGPDHLSILIHQHGPVTVIQKVLPREGIRRPVPGEGGGDLPDRCTPIPVADVVEGEDQNPYQGDQSDKGC